MRLAILAIVTIVAVPAGVVAAVSGEARPKAVLELFTSQGCSSCPSADRLIGDLDDRDEVIAVTMPVKIWDFLGWADTLATDDLTKRQIAYSVARGDRDVYTPQVVVNGDAAMVGSDLAAINAHIEGEALPLPIELSVASDVLTIRIGEAGIEADSAMVWLLVIDNEVVVPVGDGENRGRTLTYENVVREMRPVGIWKGKPATLELPLIDIDESASAGCVVLAQIETFKGPGAIVGAARLRHMFPARTLEASIK